MVSWDGPDARAFYALDPRIVWSRLGFRPGAPDKLRRTRALARLLHDHRTRILVGFVMSGDKTVYAAAKLAGVRLIVAERNAPTISEHGLFVAKADEFGHRSIGTAALIAF
jgi:GalNAc-alpha-(1->4)-GalNAc-alpha-(1->3)-diNAcBac-PP-undecaprenol alpha-1,4-N-acetyl-D-galactosaminyltransferase